MYPLLWTNRVSKLSFDIMAPLIIIPSTDFILCKLFGTRSRWFQLHSIINLVIVYITYNDVFNLFINPLNSIKIVDSKIDYYFILWLHIYHIFIGKLSFMDICHHLLFVGTGIIPCILCHSSNLIRIGSFTLCGLPGAIEYGTLSLVKHNKIKSITQKRIVSYIYNYFRYPITIYSSTLTYIAYIQGFKTNTDPRLILYVNLLLIINGSFYNKLTIENYMEHKLLVKKSKQ
jgi:hypothetical protein